MMGNVIAVIVIKINLYLIVSKKGTTAITWEIFYDAICMGEGLFTSSKAWYFTKKLFAWCAILWYWLRTSISAMSHRRLSSNRWDSYIFIRYCLVFNVQFDLEHLTSDWRTSFLFLLIFFIFYFFPYLCRWNACSLTRHEASKLTNILCCRALFFIAILIFLVIYWELLRKKLYRKSLLHWLVNNIIRCRST